MTLTVCAYNVWHGMRLESLLEYMRRTNYDVYLLSEVTSGLSGLHNEATSNLLEHVVSILPHRTIYGPMWQVTTNEGVFTQGVTIASKYPFSSTTCQYFHGNVRPMNSSFKADEHPGVLLSATITWNESPLTVVVTHFPWSLHPEITSHQQTALDKLLPLLESHPHPLIFGGDFNVTADSSIYQSLSNLLRADRDSAILSTLHPTIHPVGYKQLAVDGLFSSPALECLGTWVDDSDGSDHLPLVGKYR